MNELNNHFPVVIPVDNQPAPAPATSFSALPNEMLVNILQHMDFKDQKSMMTTSHRNHGLFQGKQLLKHIKDKRVVHGEIEFQEINATDSQKRWLELRILELPPANRLERVKLKLWEAINDIGILIVAWSGIAIINGGINLIKSGFYVIGLSATSIPLIEVVAAVICVVAGAFLLYSMKSYYRNDSYWRRIVPCVYNKMFVLVPTAISKEKEEKVYLLRIRVTFKNRIFQTKLAYFPMQRTTYDALKQPPRCEV